MLVLGIESTCDETAASVVADGKTIHSNVISSQIALHSQFGGVVPELACRRHIDVISEVVQKSLGEYLLDDINLIAVAKGPGLIGALLIGIHFAKTLAWAKKLPIVGVNHIEAHLYAAMMSEQNDPLFPALGMVLSGGHTSIVRINAIGHYEQISQTIDDAIGEAFDKTAKILGLGYPGGPIIEQLALKGNPKRFAFKAGRVKASPKDFSFSGIKTAVLYTVKKLSQITEEDVCDIAASFQEAVFLDVCHKLEQALHAHHYKALYLGGGVTLNKRLRTLIQERFSLPCYFPRVDLCLDNGAMIAGLGYHVHKHTPNLPIVPETRIPFSRPLAPVCVPDLA